MRRICVCLAVLLVFASCDRGAVRHFLHRLKTKPRTQMDALTPMMKDEGRHRQFLELIKEGGIDLLFLGDSITDWWPTVGETSWSQLARYHPANFGVSGDRTEHLLWRITHGELDGIDPKAIVILIGTNNIGNFENERPEWIAGGIRQIVATVRERLPNAKVLLLGIFPRDGRDTAQRQAVHAVNDLIRGLDDAGKTRFVDIGESFLDANGNISTDVMPDQLHLNAKGYEIWYEKIAPLLDEMFEYKIDN